MSHADVSNLDEKRVTGKDGGSGSGDAELPQLGYLWDEYKYRHELCWKAIQLSTLATVALGLVPYTIQRVAMVLGWSLLLPPILGLAFAVFSLVFIHGELKILEPVKDTYTSLQKHYALHDIRLDPCARRDLARCFEVAVATKKLFPLFVKSFLASLIVLGALNVYYVADHLKDLITASGNK
jgi:hypothetical protein